MVYKHALLHGLNASIACSGAAIAEERSFRLYWCCLNTAYVFEFFMQTLVKRQYMSQTWMLVLQNVLMLVSTVAALQVLASVRLVPALLACRLHRGSRRRRRGRGRRPH